MRQCPSCGQWTLEFDDYFGRFRCFNPDCAWMVPSSAELELRRMRSRTEPILLASCTVAELGVDFKAFYDKGNDALICDFGLTEPTVDLPEPDGRMIWKIGRETESVAGFCLLGAKRFGISELRINMQARKKDIEQRLKTLPDLMVSGRISKVLIDKVCVRAKEATPVSRKAIAPLTSAFNRALDRFEHLAQV